MLNKIYLNKHVTLGHNLTLPQNYFETSEHSMYGPLIRSTPDEKLPTLYPFYPHSTQHNLDGNNLLCSEFMINVSKCTIKNSLTSRSTSSHKTPVSIETKMGTTEYTPSNNSTFANYPVSGEFRTARFQASPRCS